MSFNFNPEDIVGNLSVEELKNQKVTKEHLKTIARSFGIPFSYDSRKDELMSLVLAHLGEDDQEESQESSLGDRNLALEIEKVKMNALRMKLNFEREMLDRELEQRRQEMEHSAQLAERQHEHELRLAQVTTTNNPNPTPVHIGKHLPLFPQLMDEDPDTSSI